MTHYPNLRIACEMNPADARPTLKTIRRDLERLLSKAENEGMWLADRGRAAISQDLYEYCKEMLHICHGAIEAAQPAPLGSLRQDFLSEYGRAEPHVSWLRETKEAGYDPTKMVVRTVTLKSFLTQIKPGSAVYRHTWEDELQDLADSPNSRRILERFENQIMDDKFVWPVIVGPDGRLWDGHHRVVAHMRQGAEYITVAFVPKTVESPQDEP